MDKKKAPKKSIKLTNTYRYTFIGASILFTFMSFKGGLPRWVYLEHALLFLAGWDLELLDYWLFSGFSYFSSFYILGMYFKNWNIARKREQQYKNAKENKAKR